MNKYMILAQITGFIALTIWVFSIQFKKKESIYLAQGIANLFYALQYSLLGALATSIMNITSLIRCLIFSYYEKKKIKVSKKLLILFISIVLIIGIISYQNILSIIPIFLTCMYTYAMFQDDLSVFKYIFMFCAMLWLIYNASVGAYVAIFGNILEIISGFIAIKKETKHT